MQTASREAPSLQALSNCYTSALQALEIVTAEFAPIGMLVSRLNEKKEKKKTDFCFLLSSSDMPKIPLP